MIDIPGQARNDSVGKEIPEQVRNDSVAIILLLVKVFLVEYRFTKLKNNKK
jgi:hypothetical protein